MQANTWTYVQSHSFGTGSPGGVSGTFVPATQVTGANSIGNTAFAFANAVNYGDMLVIFIGAGAYSNAQMVNQSNVSLVYDNLNGVWTHTTGFPVGNTFTSGFGSGTGFYGGWLDCYYLPLTLNGNPQITVQINGGNTPLALIMSEHLPPAGAVGGTLDQHSANQKNNYNQSFNQFSSANLTTTFPQELILGAFYNTNFKATNQPVSLIKVGEMNAGGNTVVLMAPKANSMVPTAAAPTGSFELLAAYEIVNKKGQYGFSWSFTTTGSGAANGYAMLSFAGRFPQCVGPVTPSVQGPLAAGLMTSGTQGFTANVTCNVGDTALIFMVGLSLGTTWSTYGSWKCTLNNGINLPCLVNTATSYACSAPVLIFGMVNPPTGIPLVANVTATNAGSASGYAIYPMSFANVATINTLAFGANTTNLFTTATTTLSDSLYATSGSLHVGIAGVSTATPTAMVPTVGITLFQNSNTTNQLGIAGSYVQPSSSPSTLAYSCNVSTEMSCGSIVLLPYYWTVNQLATFQSANAFSNNSQGVFNPWPGVELLHNANVTFATTVNKGDLLVGMFNSTSLNPTVLGNTSNIISVADNINGTWIHATNFPISKQINVGPFSNPGIDVYYILNATIGSPSIKITTQANSQLAAIITDFVPPLNVFSSYASYASGIQNTQIGISANPNSNTQRTANVTTANSFGPQLLVSIGASPMGTVNASTALPNTVPVIMTVAEDINAYNYNLQYIAQANSITGSSNITSVIPKYCESLYAAFKSVTTAAGNTNVAFLFTQTGVQSSTTAILEPVFGYLIFDMSFVFGYVGAIPVIWLGPDV